MALSYGLTNPAAGMISASTPEPVLLAYKMYAQGGTNILRESSDYGMSWRACSITNGRYYNIVYDRKNNKIVSLGDYSPYSGSYTCYVYYATPKFNGTTSFTRGASRTKSPQGSTSTSSRYNQYGSVYDFQTDSLISLRRDVYHDSSTTPNYVYFINANYSSPNTFATAAFRNTASTVHCVVTGDNGITLELSKTSSANYSGRLFRFSKSSNTSYSKTQIANISTSTLDISNSNGYINAAYLKDKGFVVWYGQTSSSTKVYTKFISLTGTVSSAHDWGTKENADISADNYCSDRVYFVKGKKVYYTTDGTNWNTCSGQLPANIDSNVGAAVFNTKGIITVSIDSGNKFAVSVDGGATWSTGSDSGLSTITYGTSPMNQTVRDYGATIIPYYCTNNIYPNNPTFTTGYWIDNSGNITAHASNFYLDDYIPIDPDTSYMFIGKNKTSGAMSFYNRISYYDANRDWISTTGSSGKGNFITVTSPSNAAYARISCNPTGSTVNQSTVEAYDWFFFKESDFVPNP